MLNVLHQNFCLTLLIKVAKSKKRCSAAPSCDMHKQWTGRSLLRHRYTTCRARVGSCFTWSRFNSADIENVDAVIRAVTEDVGPRGVENKSRITCETKRQSAHSGRLHIPRKQAVQYWTIPTETHAHTRPWVGVRLQRNGVMSVCSVVLPKIPHLYDSGWDEQNRKTWACKYSLNIQLTPACCTLEIDSSFSPINSPRGDEGVLILKQNHCDALLGIL